MHTVDDITEIVRDPETSLPGNKYLGVYNKLLSGLFEESRFLVIFPKLNCMEVVICNRRVGIDPKSVLLLLALDEVPNSDESAAVDKEMRKLLMEANTPEIRTIHGLCVWETRVAFYCYDREQGVVAPSNKGHVHFDLDLKDEDGATAVIEVAKDVKRMCKALVKEAKAKVMRS